MIRIRFLPLSLLLVCSWALAQNTAPPTNAQAAGQTSAPTPRFPRLFTPYGTFERVAEGWRCNHVGSAPPELLRNLQPGDVLTAIDGRDLTKASPVGLLQFLRLTEFDVAASADVVRDGRHLKFTAPDTLPQIIASQDSLKVLHSTYTSVRQGDILMALNQTSFAAMLATVTNPLTSVANVEARPGKTLYVERSGKPADVAIDRGAMVRLVNFELDPAQEPPSSENLRGLNTSKVALQSLRGRWTLLHFWATWCTPCIRHMPDIRELAQREDLFVVAIGFADSEERLRAAAAQEQHLKVFAPDPALQRELAITGIPYDALVDPQGNAVLVVAGDMPRDEFKNVITHYLGR